MRAFLLAAVLAAPLAASAQGSDPWPLAPGNSWTYTSRFTSTGASSGEISLRGAATWTVLDSVDSAAGRLPRVAFGTGECLVRKDRSLGYVRFELLAVAGDAPCAVRPVFTISGPGFGVPNIQIPTSPFDVGGEAVAADTARFGFDDDGGTGISRFVGQTTADGLGVVSFGENRHVTGTTNSSLYATLRQATLGGVTVGQPLGTRTDFWPLAAGNRWEFLVTDLSGASIGAVAWTVEAAGSGLALRMQRVQGGAVVSGVTCPISLVAASPETTWQTGFTLPGCSLPDPALAPLLPGAAPALGIDVYTVGRAVSVGGQAVTADAADGRTTLGNTPNFVPREAVYRLVRGIGPVSYVVDRRFAPVERWTATLAFARVGGTTYGQQVVAGEAPPEAAALAFTAGPNPARGALALAFTLPAPGSATVEVIDALGRTVLWHDLGAQAAGSGTAQVDLSGVAAGVYSVRLVAGNVRASVRISVVR